LVADDGLGSMTEGKEETKAPCLQTDINKPQQATTTASQQSPSVVQKPFRANFSA
jgi:hypothetical protein